MRRPARSCSVPVSTLMSYQRFGCVPPFNVPTTTLDMVAEFWYVMYCSFQSVAGTSRTLKLLVEPAHDSLDVCSRSVADSIVRPPSALRSNMRNAVSVPYASARRVLETPGAVELG